MVKLGKSQRFSATPLRSSPTRSNATLSSLPGKMGRDRGPAMGASMSCKVLQLDNGTPSLPLGPPFEGCTAGFGGRTDLRGRDFAGLQWGLGRPISGEVIGKMEPA